MSSIQKARERHARYYQTVLKPLNEQYLQSRDDEKLVTKYDLEQGQIEHAVDWIKNLQSDPNLLSLFHSYLDEGDPLLSRSWLFKYVVELEEKYKYSERYEEKQVLLGHLGQCYARLGIYSFARERYETKMILAQEKGDHFSEMETYNNLSFVHILNRDFLQASKLQERVITVARKDARLPHLFIRLC
jgi:tetratricopeptide (TPR) repeat protein